MIDKLTEKIRKAEKSIHYKIDGAIIDLFEDICITMEKSGITRDDLQKSTGFSKKRLQHIFGGWENVTLRELVTIVECCNLKIRIEVR